jgi:hypothetical protein
VKKYLYGLIGLALAVLMGSCIFFVPNAVASDSSENTWTALPTQELGTLCGVTAVNGKIYVMSFNMINNKWVNTVYIYDLQTNTWSTKTPITDEMLQGAICQISSVVYGDKIYYFGTGSWSTGILNNKVYSTTTNQLSTLNPEPQKRFGASACIVDDKIYVVGGFVYGEYVPNQKIQPRTAIDLVEMYDPATNIWTTKQSMEKIVDNPLLIVVKEKIYVFDKNYIQIYDTKTDHWRILPENPTNHLGGQGYQNGAATAGKYAPQRIYLFGDGSWPEPSGAIYIFDPQTETYTGNTTYPEHKSEQYPSLTFGYYESFQVVVVDDVFYLIGGGVSARLEQQRITSEGKIKTSSEPVSFRVDYKYVPFGYSSVPLAPEAQKNNPSNLVFTVAGIVVAASIVAAVSLLLFQKKRKSKNPTEQST